MPSSIRERDSPTAHKETCLLANLGSGANAGSWTNAIAIVPSGTRTRMAVIE
ncbi:MAG TPA: hypothetical protein VFJ24_10635 [Gaiellales bacterium]|nr:hypothetical protein [Gaiellales bacterium]